MLLWDAHNTWRKTGDDPAALWPVIRRRVAHLHVKDSISRPSARHPFTFVLPGAGEFPMSRLRQALAGDYEGLVSLEWERQWHPYLPPLAEALAHAGRTGWW
jgi:sugar phosphate isomerase/epimerase